jgi:CheY-like chemotaxis protein
MTAPAKTILVVEDQADVLELAVSFLAEQGYDVIAAESGDEAIRRLRERPGVDLVFTDIVMPGTNGFGVARRAIAHDPATKILYTTGYADQLRRNEPLVARGNLMAKPYRLAALGARIAELLTTPPEELNKTLRLGYRRWRALRGVRGRPGEAAFLSDDAGGLRPFVSLVEPTSDGGFRYRLLGSSVVEDIGIDLAGQPVGGAVPDEHRRFLIALYAEAVATGLPIYVASVYATAQATVATERLFLPLVADAGASVAVVQTFDRIDTKATIYEVMKENPLRRDHVRRIDLDAPAAT